MPDGMTFEQFTASQGVAPPTAAAGTAVAVPIPPAPAAGPMSFEQFTGSAPAAEPDGYLPGGGLHLTIHPKGSTPREGIPEAGGTAPPPVAPSTGPVGNLGAGVNEAIASPGLIVDAASGAINLGSKGINALAGTNIPMIQNPVGGSESIKSALGLIGADPRTVVPADELDTIMRAAGRGAGSMLIPSGVVAAAIRTGIAPATGIARGVINSLASAGPASSVAAGAVGGAAGQYAADRVPAPLKPMVDMAGNLIGGGLVLGSVAATRRLIDAGLDVAGNYLAPLTEGGQQALAGQRLLAASSNPGELAGTLDEATAQAPVVPGSQPTTFQATGDQKLGNLERAVASNNPAPFLQRRADQNAAQVGAINALSPQGANVEDVGALFRRQLGALDTSGQAQIAQGRANVGAALDRAGGGAAAGNPDEGQTALQGYGSTIRGGAAGADEIRAQRERALWAAVDPDGTLALATAGLRRNARSIASDMPRLARPMEGEEAAIFHDAQALPPVEQFSEIAALRSRLTDAMRNELSQNGRTPAYRRMSQLLEGIHDALEGAVDQRDAEEARAVSGGQMSPEDTMTAHMASLRQDWYADRHAAAQDLASAGNGAGSDAGRNAGVRPGGIPSVAGGPVAAGGRLGSSPGGAGLQGEPLVPNFDEAAAQRYGLARQATAERKATGAEGTVGDVLQPGRRSGEYALPLSQVAGRFFNSGSHAAEDIQQFQRAFIPPPGATAQQVAAFQGARQEAMASLQDYAAFSLRRAAERPDGTLDLRAYQSWINRHGEALSTFPEVQARFGDAAAAQRSLEDAQAAHQTNLDAYQRTAASRFLGDADPVATVGRLLGSDNRVAAFRQLAALTQNDAAARAGLQRAVAQHMQARLQSNVAAGQTGTTLLKSDTFQTFVRHNAEALSQIFSPEQVSSMEAVAADLQRANQSIAGSKLPGGSNTAQDVAAQMRHTGQEPSILTKLVMEGGAGGAGFAMGGPIGAAAGWLGSSVGNSLRTSGLRKVDDLVTEAMLNPDLARTLLTKVPPGSTIKADIAAKLASEFHALRMQSLEAAGSPMEPPKRPAGAPRSLTPQNVPRVSAPMATAPRVSTPPAPVAAPSLPALPTSPLGQALLGQSPGERSRRASQKLGPGPNGGEFRPASPLVQALTSH